MSTICTAVDVHVTYCFSFLLTNTQYPAQARPQRLRGNVMVEFIVDSTGAVRNSVVKEGLGGGCDEEAVRVVGLLGRFTPAQRDCRPVSTRVAVPVAFAPPTRPAK